MIDKTLGHYRIINQLGKGGMGEVYQAKDQKLGRDVAIKILPEEFARNADRVARFQREAKLLASLNHQNIAAIYGLEESSGTNFLVLELVEGETLADRIKAGPVPVEEALKLALQIAEALEAAHEKGVIHRDLKPANIKVTPEGKVKVLDFGLAKAFASDQSDLDLSNSPTLSNAATQQGVILGTAAYMSPEQARGKAVDKRADIWAFGCILFEMLTGRPAFSGQDVSDIFAAIIRAEPEWGNLSANLPRRLQELLERCLSKNLKDRYHDISDVRGDIQRIQTDPSVILAQPVTALEHRTGQSFRWILAVVLVAVIVGLAAWRFKPSTSDEPHQVIRFSYELPKDTTGFAVSRDGKQFVYSTPRGIYLRSLNELDDKLIQGTEGNPRQPFFSPDGKWIGYWSGTDIMLKKIGISGGAAVDLCPVQRLGGAIWNSDNTILFSDQPQLMIMRISANGGTPEVLISKGFSYAPQLLPDGKSILFTDVSAQPYRIRVQSLESGKQKELFVGQGAQYLSTGHIIYTIGNGPYNLVAIPFNLNKLEASGGPIPVLNGIMGAAVSDSGTLAYMPGTKEATLSTQRMPVWVDQKGKEEPIAGAPTDFSTRFSLSPDGKQVAFIRSASGNSNVWIWDLDRGMATRLTFNELMESFPLWTPDGRRIVYQSMHLDGRNDLYMKAADGTGDIAKLGSFPFSPGPSSWSRDGKILVMAEVGFNPLRGDITTLSMEGGHARKPLLQEKYVQTQSRVSPDGRWIAYVSLESGRPEIFVRPFPEVNKGKWQISATGGMGPLWSIDSRKLFYRSDDAVVAVGVETEPTFKPGKPEILFRANYYYWKVGQSVQPMWDIRPDGKFMMVKEVQPQEKTPPAEISHKINIVLNWFEELKQRAPVK
jgi:eukaryotic-like serine/threonine-protein kinase